MSVDPVRLEIFKHLFASVAEEMGGVLRRSSYSPNIKERKDFSCAIFSSAGDMVAQAEHIPVHLGSMPLSVRACLEELELGPGDVAILNDPFRGGTHLPDITLVAPVFTGPDGARIGFVAARAHHADVGGMTPGSMPLATELYQEGLVIPPIRLVAGGKILSGIRDLILANVRTPQERSGDLDAQLAAVQRGADRLGGLSDRYGADAVGEAMEALLAYAERTTRRLLSSIPDGTYRFRDAMEDDGRGGGAAAIDVAITVQGDAVRVDFTGTDDQREAGINAVRAITLSAVYYVFRSLVGLDLPSNSGCLAPIELVTRPGSLVDARRPAPVAGGNVETSQRIVDVLLGALAGACPDRIPAASQGTMNNLVLGGLDPATGLPFTYYETVAGGAGAGASVPGASALHTHMTNTLNTPVEALEYAYPFRVTRYEVRRGSGGRGRWPGGEGVVREVELGAHARLTLLTERRRLRPYGLAGGGPGAAGRNLLVRDGREEELPGKVSLDVRAGDRVRLETPGGGGWGEAGET
ncbi:MAG: hydantoinase B/oxoprolinase family protein [Candidatus Palauibacterales bacterium]|nr:hydantoinase B/oxoprolinase family protein [Candidatus Palauibacterales bacterium]MDP2528971.1 hydantoinase B/oxoprolinase family protein [Candidatus Palauibacterales bacterium]MDP2583789.1 hydantoinase B/oxoprolinase family protein [Candidatus Palauibacterales bacterium]